MMQVLYTSSWLFNCDAKSALRWLRKEAKNLETSNLMQNLLLYFTFHYCSVDALQDALTNAQCLGML